MDEMVKGSRFDDKKIECNYNKEDLDKRCNTIYNRFMKRLLGLIVALILFILLLPFLLIISIIIVIDSGFPIFYKADRGGYRGKSFRIYKFRTMVKNADKIGGGTTSLNDSRITRVGNFLRKIKIDEIPQLINIIKGDMSFIGPRPELLKYTLQYDEIEKYILKVRPGITDFSSIEFINLDEIVGSENADEMYEKYVLRNKNLLRIKYVASTSFMTDCSLFFITVVKTLKKAKNLIFTAGGMDGKDISQ